MELQEYKWYIYIWTLKFHSSKIIYDMNIIITKQLSTFYAATFLLRTLAAAFLHMSHYYLTVYLLAFSNLDNNPSKSDVSTVAGSIWMKGVLACEQAKQCRHVRPLPSYVAASTLASTRASASFLCSAWKLVLFILKALALFFKRWQLSNVANILKESSFAKITILVMQFMPIHICK